MSNIFKEQGGALVGGEMVPFRQIVVQQRFHMWVPDSFREEANLPYRYTYLANPSKSPLSIAVRHAAVENTQLREKMLDSYFGASGNHRLLEDSGGKVRYRESVSSGTFMSIYSLRFAIQVEDGLLLGCFNCPAAYQDHWRDTVFQMLRTVEPC